MENPSTGKPGSQIMPQTLAPSNSGRRRRSTDSPEFEFWMLRNPSIPQPDLLSADELFVDGVLLPLHLLHLHPNHPSHDPTDGSHRMAQSPVPEPKTDSGPGPELSNAPSEPSNTSLGASKRWKDMFKKSDRKNEDKEREKKNDRKAANRGDGGASSAELNINIWPFSRSRSAGNGENQPRATTNRKVSSAPCSRSNSAGESKFRSSLSRGRVQLGRSSPVWKIRRGGSRGKSFDRVAIRSQKEGSQTGRKKTATTSGGIGSTGGGWATGSVLNSNDPMCVGYGQRLSDGNSAFNVAAMGGGDVGGGESGGSGPVDGGHGGNLLNLRSLFTNKLFPLYG